MLEPIICPWFLCLYINVLPLYTTCRVWDCLFWEGSVVLFRIGLTLMKSKARPILEATDFIGIYGVLKSPSGGVREHSFVLESAASAANSHSSAALDTTASVSSTGSGSAEQLAIVSDSQHLINSAFGFRWMRSVPKAKVDLLRQKFHRLLDDSHDERFSTGSGSSKVSSPKNGGDGSSPTRKSGTAKRTRKSTFMLRVLEENEYVLISLFFILTISLLTVLSAQHHGAERPGEGAGRGAQQPRRGVRQGAAHGERRRR